MYKHAARKMAIQMLNNGIGKNIYKDIYIYGFECVISIAANLFFIFCVGIFLGILKEVTVFTVSYVMLRINSGGAHRKTHFQCTLTYISLMLLGIYGIGWLGKIPAGKYFFIIILIYCLVIVILYSPAESVNKPLETKLKKQLRVKSIYTILIEEAIILVCLFSCNLNSIITSAMAGVFIQTNLLLPFFNKERRYL